MILGIDPGYLTGVCHIAKQNGQWRIRGHHTWRSDRILTELDTCTLALSSCPDSLTVAIQTPFFAGKTPRFFKGDKSGVSFAKQAALAERIAGWCEGKGFHVVRVPPLRKSGMKANPVVWRSQFTWPEWKRLPSQHARDAAMIALHVAEQEGLRK